MTESFVIVLPFIFILSTTIFLPSKILNSRSIKLPSTVSETEWEQIEVRYRLLDHQYSQEFL